MHRELALSRETVAERLPLHVWHDVVEKAVGLARVEQGQDVRVLQPGRDLDLAGEPLRAQGGRELGTEHFDGDLAAGASGLRPGDDGHPALPELALEQVAGAQRLLQSFTQFHSTGRERRTQM